MSNSSLVSFTKISPNRNSPRNHAIDTISIHCVVGQASVESLGNVFASSSRQASSNYGVGYDGKVGMYVEEKDRSWCTSSAENDNRAVTIEVASDTTEPYAVTDAALKSLIKLCADICKRNGIKELKWKGDKSLIGQVDKQNMTVHRWFANKSCPGTYLYERHGYIASEVNKLLNGDTGTKTKTLYRVQVGAYSVKANAEKQLQTLKSAGYKDAILVSVSPYYKVQLGAFSVKQNAENLVNELKKKGFSAFVTTKGGTTVAQSSKKSVDELAKEVLEGKWGTGSERKRKLTQAGYDYDAVQAKVNQLLKK